MLFAPSYATASVPVAPAPVNTGAPSPTGTPLIGQTLTCSQGSWANNPTGYTYAWLRDGTPIAGQTGSTYVVQNADQAHSLSCRVTANNEGGDYTISSLASGSYTVGFYSEFTFNAEGGANYQPQFFNGKPGSAEATSVTVSAPNATGGVNAEMHAGGEIAGRVVAAGTKAPLANVFVCAEQVGGTAENCTLTNANGEYAVPGLVFGSYAVGFFAFIFEIPYRSEFYKPPLGVENPGEGLAVAVTADSTTGGINAELRPFDEGAEIKGTVTNSGATGIEGIEVCATEGEGFAVFRGCATTNKKGEYTISNLPAGKFIVSFSPASCISTGCNYVLDYYKETPLRESAEQVTLAAHGKATVNTKMTLDD